MKKYKIALRFPKYDHTSSISVNDIDEIRPIAENAAFNLLIKSNIEPHLYDRVKCEIYDLKGNTAFGQCNIYVNPVYLCFYQNKETGELFRTKRQCFKNFFRCLFKYRILATYRKLENKKPLFKGGRK